MEEPGKEIETAGKPPISKKKLIRNCFITILAISLGYIHYTYVSTLFENDRNFSYLSELEREMSLRTEMGFYYSYFKTVVQENQFVISINKILNDKLVEYPGEVNAFRRFNVLPEVLIGAAYRYFETSINTTALRQCHLVDRGENLAPVESCVGIGEPIFFYLETIWWLAGLTVTALFMQAYVLSQSVLGGMFAVVNYMANHAECTRVQWAPNERENIAMPLLLLHSWLITAQLTWKENRRNMYLQVLIFMVNCACLLSWQFTQFIFLTHAIIFFLMEQFRIIESETLSILLHSHVCGLHTAILVLQGNDMLVSSLYASFFFTATVYCLFFSSYKISVKESSDVFVELWLVLLRVTIMFAMSLLLKRIVSEYLDVNEDSHVWYILLSKFTNFKSFHTLIYTCSEVFDFLPWKTVKGLIQSFLLPTVGFVLLNICVRWIWKAFELTEEAISKKETNDDPSDKSEKESDTDDSGIENNAEVTIRKRNDGTVDLDTIDKKVEVVEVDAKEVTDKFVMFLQNLNMEPAIVFNVGQLIVYGMMAGLVMRLKLLFTPQLCIVSSLLFSEKNYSILPKSLMKYLPILWMVILTPILYSLFSNMSKEMSHIGEFSDVQQEQLLQWISGYTSPGAVFAGSMPILSAVMLSTRRPIVIHPHYENAALRRRVYSVYKMYGKFSPEQLYKELSALKVSYLIVETEYCYGRSSNGCSFAAIWDTEQPHQAARPLLCHRLLTERVDNLYKVFENKHYAVFNVHDLSVSYMPRSFGT